MFQILYRCVYRDHWYDDIDLETTIEAATWTAQQVYEMRRTPVCVVDLDSRQVVYRIG